MHEEYMAIALDEAKIALNAGDFPVGCVIVDDKGVICSAKRENSRTLGNELDHAEIVALRKLYSTHRNRIAPGLVIYSSMEPCLMCFSTLIVNNITTIVYAYEDVMGGGTNLPLQSLSPLYASMKINILPHIGRADSLMLFQKFFNNKKNEYLRESLLARYTLEQKI